MGLRENAEKAYQDKVSEATSRRVREQAKKCEERERETIVNRPDFAGDSNL